jgi:[ribosomal protein S5]-alanine N-acetyltransferase
MSTMPSRVELSPLTLADQDEFCSLVRASAELHRPWVQLPPTAQEFHAWMRRFEDGTNLGFLVRIAETGAAAGMVNINSIIRGRYQGASLGYAAFAAYAGQGYMAEGLTATLRHAFDDLRLHRLEANIQPGNKASLALVQRLGFHYEGLSPAYLYIDGAWRDHERWSITAPAPWTPHPTLPEV